MRVPKGNFRNEKENLYNKAISTKIILCLLENVRSPLDNLNTEERKNSYTLPNLVEFTTILMGTHTLEEINYVVTI